MLETNMRPRHLAICTFVLLSCFQISPTLASEEDLLAKYPIWESDAEAKAMSVVMDLDGDDTSDVVASDGSFVWLHSGRTGSVIWEQNLESLYGHLRPPVIRNLEIGDVNAVVVRLVNRVKVINLDDRSTVWTVLVTGESLGVAYREEVVITIPDSNGDGVTDVALDSDDGESITVLDGRNGDVIWEKWFNGTVMSILSVPDMDGNDVDDLAVCAMFFPLNQTHILCLGGNDGSVLWNSTIPTTGFISSTYLPQGVIIVSSTSARYLDLTIALDPETGEPLWNVTDLGGHAKPFKDKYAETVPNVIVSSEEQGVVLLDWETGDEIWKEETVGKPQKILITDDLNGDECEDVVVTVCVGEEGDYLYAIEGKEGEFIWKYQPFTSLEVSQLASMDDVDNDGVNDVLIAWYDCICLLGGSNIMTVKEYNRILSRHGDLYSEYRELHDVHSNLLLEHNITKDNYDRLVMDYETLSNAYEELQSDHENAIGLLDELETDYETLSAASEQIEIDYEAVTRLLDETIKANATTSNLMYTFLGTTVLFVLATMYLTMRLRGR